MNRIIAIAVAFVLFLLTLILFAPISSGGDQGLCIASPNQWHLPKFIGWLLNTGLLVLSASVMASANKRYNFAQEPDTIMPLSLLLIMGCSCICTATLSTSTLLLFINVLSLFVIFSTYEDTNATRQFFVIATLPAIGAMIQYSFLVMIPVYIGAGMLMKSFRLRELVAFVFGLVAPYWIAVGLGWIPLGAFRMPEPLTVFSTAEVNEDIFISIIAVAIMGALGVILSLYNGLKLFMRNSRLRCMQMSVNLMGYACVLAVIFDFNNFVAYMGTLALWVAVEVATLVSLYEIRRPGVVLTVVTAVFLPFYILALCG